MIDSWLAERSSGREQSPDAIRGFVEACVQGTVTRPQMAAWLAFVFCRGMTAAETVVLTEAMTDSGDRMDWGDLPGPFWDKHSTGGVGDKVSLVLAPLWAAMGHKVPMLSGRGLGITGGTLDKLEAIPGFRTDLVQAELQEILNSVGCFISGQTEELAPADRILYALRNETQTVASLPLITASILSKKLVEGLDGLVLDVKFGSGAFMKTKEAATELADMLVAVGNGAGVRTEAHLSPMSEPLGRAVGNALEVQEAAACLQGNGPDDLSELVEKLSGDPVAAKDALQSGRAYQKWLEMVRAQGGDTEAPLRGSGCRTWTLEAGRNGTVTGCDAGEIGTAVFRLGAGRQHADGHLDMGVGAILHKKCGEEVRKGQPLATLYHRGKNLRVAQAAMRSAYRVTS